MVKYILLALLISLSSQAEDISAFTKHEKYRYVKISPSGKYIAISRFQNNESDLVIVDAKTMKAVNQLYFRRQEEVGTFYWANDERLVIKIVAKKPSRESPVYYGELYAINIDNKQGKLIFGNRILATKPKNSKERKVFETHKAMSRSWASIVSMLPNDDKHILIAAEPYSSNKNKLSRLYKLNVYTAAITPVAKEPLPNSWFQTDINGELLLAVGINEHYKKAVFKFNKADKTWHEVNNFDYGKGFHPLTFDDKTNSLLVLDNIEHDTRSLYSFNIDTGERSLVYNNPTNDISRVYLSDDNQHLLGLKVIKDYPTYHFPDLNNKHQAVYKSLTDSFPGQHVNITSNTADLTKFIVFVYSDRNPGNWYLFDSITNSAKFVASANSNLKPASLLPMLAFSFKSRDQANVSGYITLPKATVSKNLPAIILVHGGPYGVRDIWGYDSEVQLLASQGYAVVQINYRGSGGFGSEFVTSAHKHWGDMIQQDILDGTDYLIKNNLLDPEKICIMGGSFGGYSAVQASILAPKKFQCAIAAYGVYDLFSLYKDGDINNYLWGKSFLNKTIGIDEQTLKKFSPTHNVDAFNTPLLMVHGELDERAPFDQAYTFRKKLKRKNKSHEWLLFDDEGHGIYNEENRLEYYNRVIKFLNKHNPI